MKTTVNQRFEQMITSLGLVKNAFAKQVGVASTQVYNIINGRNAPSFDLLSKIAITFPTVNITWLLTGKGEPILKNAETSGESMELIGKIKTLEEKLEDMGEKLKNKEKMDEQTVSKVLKKMLANKS